MEKILVIEDSSDMQEMLVNLLSPKYQITSAYSGTEGLLLFNQVPFSLIILDRMLPGKSGAEVLAAIRLTSQIPVIILTALDDASEIAQFLLAGANDYITKPFNIDELSARITVQLRNTAPQQSKVLTYRKITLNSAQFIISNGQHQCSLKKKELAIIQLLFSHPNTIFTKEHPYETIWNEPFLDNENTINVHLSNLRHKLNQLDPTHEYIETIWGIGVRLS